MQRDSAFSDHALDLAARGNARPSEQFRDPLLSAIAGQWR
jgi:hypothetical protein